MKFCEGCHGCFEPCVREEKAFRGIIENKEKPMTKYEKLRLLLGVIQIITVVILALNYRGIG